MVLQRSQVFALSQNTDGEYEGSAECLNCPDDNAEPSLLQFLDVRSLDSLTCDTIPHFLAAMLFLGINLHSTTLAPFWGPHK